MHGLALKHAKLNLCMIPSLYCITPQGLSVVSLTFVLTGIIRIGKITAVIQLIQLRLTSTIFKWKMCNKRERKK